MITQPNQPQRECLYAWYPEAILETGSPNPTNPREIYLHNGLDKDLLADQSSTTNGFTSVHNNGNINGELHQRYKQSIAPSDRAYHSTETIDEALTPPWALHYQIARQPATPNLPSNSNEMKNRDEPMRRLKSAPVARTLPPATVLTIPQPRFIDTIIQVPPPPASSSRPVTRASSAKARLNTTAPAEPTPSRREIKSAQGSRRKDPNRKLSEKEIQEIFERVYGHEIARQSSPQTAPVQIIYTQPQSTTPQPPPPVYVYERSATWHPEDPKPKSAIRKSIEVSAIPLNPHYLHRPGVIAVNNVEKRSVVRETSAAKKSTKHHHRRYHSQGGKRAGPLLAITPIQPKSRLSLEIAGAKLTYDPKITLDDRSANLTKYFIDGRLYLIKDQRYNVVENIDPSTVQDYNQSLRLPHRPKYYQTIPLEKFEIPPPVPDVHYNASETYFYNTLPKRVPRYVVDPNFISEDINVNRMSISKRQPTATVYA